MKLVKQNSNKPDFSKLTAMIKTMEDLLLNKKTDLTIAELLNFQDAEGSFRLFKTTGHIPREAIIDFVNTQTYIAAAILMKDYLKGNRAVESSLKRALEFSEKTGFVGHGYDANKTLEDILNIFIKGGLKQFLEKERELCPKFNILIHNILYMFQANLKNGITFGVLGEDYSAGMAKILQDLKPDSRYYIAYGSNMYHDQMLHRCPNARAIGKTYLKNWQFQMPFYANIMEKDGALTPCFIWEITYKDEAQLDIFEGFSKAYMKREVLFEINGVETTGLVYVMTPDYEAKNYLAPADYPDKIKKGYIQSGFSNDDFRETVAPLVK